MRAVLDADVLVSAAIAHGPSHRIVQAKLEGEAFELVCEINQSKISFLFALERAGYPERGLDRRRDRRPDEAYGRDALGTRFVAN